MIDTQTVTDTALALATGGLPALDFDLEQFAGQGSETITAADLRFPFISILQTNSKPCQPGDGKYLDDARPGMIYNDLTKGLVSGKTGISVIPCYFTHDVKEWMPRGTGGVKAAHPLSSLRNVKLFRTTDSGRQIPITADGNDLIETATHYILVVDRESGSAYEAILAMTSSQLKISKQWNSLILNLQIAGKKGLFNPARFSQIYTLTTTPEKNKAFNYLNWQVGAPSVIPATQPDLLRRAIKWAKTVPEISIEFRLDTDSGDEVDSAPSDSSVPF